VPALDRGVLVRGISHSGSVARGSADRAARFVRRRMLR
jgi:hypothetical protein